MKKKIVFIILHGTHPLPLNFLLKKSLFATCSQKFLLPKLNIIFFLFFYEIPVIKVNKKSHKKFINLLWLWNIELNVKRYLEWNVMTKDAYLKRVETEKKMREKGPSRSRTFWCTRHLHTVLHLGYSSRIRLVLVILLSCTLHVINLNKACLLNYLAPTSPRLSSFLSGLWIIFLLINFHKDVFKTL